MTSLSRHNRIETERFKSFTYDDLMKRDKVNLDIFWLKDEALEESANLPAPEIIAADLEAALEQFTTIAEDLKLYCLVPSSVRGLTPARVQLLLLPGSFVIDPVPKREAAPDQGSEKQRLNSKYAGSRLLCWLDVQRGRPITPGRSAPSAAG
ncbi:MAG: hypothetical protein ACRD2L_11440 [Terriglobia bacterium]